jgi:outer membrane usher protein
MMARLKQQFRCNSLGGLLVFIIALLCGAGSGFAKTPVVDDLPTAGHLLDEPKDQTPAPGKADALPDKATGDGLPAAGHLADGAATGGAAPSQAPLQLEVLINGYKVDLVAGFSRLPNGNLAATRSELAAVGLKTPGKGPDNEVVPLLSIPSLKYQFDELGQTIDIRIADNMRIPKRFNLIPEESLMEAQSDLGVVLNYSAYAAADTYLYQQKTNFSGASINLDGRAFSKLGVLQQTATVGTTTFSDFTATRLNSTFTYSNQKRAETYRLGDIVSGGLNWTRPMRMGGAQVQRNFSLRPDLITTPLPSLQGTAALPSTLDVYLNGLKAYSQEVPAGPFEVTRLPVISSQGAARVVLTDTTGRQTTSEKPIYNSAMLLGNGYFDYSVDIGFARRSFGTASFDYDSEILGLASARFGLSDFLTVEAHAEAKPDLIEGGAGAVLQAGPFGTFNAALAASEQAGDFGAFAYGAWDFQYKDLLVHAASSRTFGNFTDLAAATALRDSTGISASAVPRAMDQITLSYGFPQIEADVGLSLSHLLLANGTETAPLGLSVTKSFPHEISVFAGAYLDLANTNNFGASMGFSMPLGKSRDINVESNATYDNTGYSAAASAFKQMDSSYGSYGWRVAAREQSGEAVSASGGYRAAQAVVAGALETAGGKLGGRANVEGSLVATKAGVFIGNPVSDSFAVVNAGVADMPVSYENRFVGKTGKNGKILLTQVRSYHPTRVSIDATSLPLNSNVTETDKRIAPREMSGVVVDFGVQKESTAAIVILKDEAGAYLPAGTEITLADHKEPFIMGYDGQVYVTDLTARNALTAQLSGKTCQAAFDYKSDANTQTLIGPLTCL